MDNLTAYDIHSIMHYDGTLGNRFPINNPVMKDKITGKSIGVNTKLSPLDIEKLNQMYPCKPRGLACGKFLYYLLPIDNIGGT